MSEEFIKVTHTRTDRQTNGQTELIATLSKFRVTKLQTRIVL